MTYSKKRIPITPDSWTPIPTPSASPVMFRGMSIKNAGASAVRLRTDPNDPSTEDELPPGYQEIIPQPYWVAPNSTIVWVQAVSGTGPLILTTVV